MTWVKKIASLIRGIQKAYAKKWSFLAVFLAVFFINLSALVALDLLPEAPARPVVSVSESPLVAGVGNALPQTEGELPISIEIPSVGVSATIKNPESTNIKVLDRALETGAVRYPTSAKLGEEGNVVLFGHSSYLPVVHNEAFKAFNAIQNLEEGDRITVRSEGRVYVYAVDKVMEANAESAAIPLQVTGKRLTLATCDSFGSKADRFVVTATLVESYPAGN